MGIGSSFKKAAGQAKSFLGSGQSIIDTARGKVDFKATPFDVDEAAFQDQTLAANQEMLRRRAAAAEGRQAPTTAAPAVGGTTLAPASQAGPVGVRGTSTPGGFAPPGQRTMGGIDKFSLLASTAPGAQGATPALVGPTTAQGPIRLAPVDLQAAQAGPTTVQRPGQLAPVDLRGAQAGGVGVAPAAAIATGQQGQFRADERLLSETLRQRVAGQGASVAELQLRAGQDRNIQQTIAAAASARGDVNPALLARLAGRDIATTNQQTAQDAAILRAQEQAAARGELAGVSQAGRAADIGLAGQQAELQQRTSEQQAQINSQLQALNAQLRQEGTLTEAQINERLQIEQARLQRETSGQQATIDAQLQTLNAQLRQDATLTEADINARLAQEQARLESAANLQQGGIDRDIQLANLRAQQETALAQGNIDLARSLEQARLQLEAGTVNVAAGLQQQKLNDQLVSQFVSQGLTLDQAQFEANQRLQALEVEQNLGIQRIGADVAIGSAAGGQKFAGSLASGIGSVLSLGAFSDRRLKKNIRPGAKDVGKLMEALEKRGKDKDVELKRDKDGTYAFLDALKPYVYEYKDPSMPGTGPGKFLGVMAQDLQKSGIGRRMVSETPVGKQVDIIRGFSALMAAMPEFHKRIKSLEGRAT